MSQIVEEGNFYDEGYKDDERVVENRVKFSETRLYGRESELQSLKEIYNKVCAANSSEVVLISGYSGTGKSAIVRRLAEEIQVNTQNGIITTDRTIIAYNGKEQGTQRIDNTNATTKSCFFLTGKFDELQSADPFSAIGQAFSEFARVLYSKENEDGRTLERVRSRALEAVGSEGKVLTHLFPSLNCILGEMETSIEQEDSGGEDVPLNNKLSNSKCDASAFGGAAKQKMWNRLTYIFPQFVKAICAEEHSLVLFLDDLQWADTTSLDLITSLIQDSSLRNFLFIGAVRSNEIHDNHPLNQNLINVITQQQMKEIHRFDLMNLSLEAINTFISETLDVHLDETLPLTRALYSKTRGNIFFTMQALEEWNRKNIIYYSAISFQWEWNLKQVEQEGLLLSDDVISVVAMKIKTLPGILQEALSIASYTRSKFDVETLLSLLNVVGKHKHDGEQLVRLLDIAILENLVSNIVGSKDYKFAHDRIQQAAYYSIPTQDDRDNLRHQIGMHLWTRGSSNAGEDWMLFVAADHLNHSFKVCGKGNTKDDDFGRDSLELAKLNLVVGEKAMRAAAFTPASTYLRMAQKIVSGASSPWNNHYELTLRSLSAVMDAELALGNNETGYNIGQQILKNARTTDDKLPTYRSLSLSLARQERNREALDYCLIALPLLCKFPSRLYFLKAMAKMKDVEKLLKKHSNQDILRLPKMTDKRQLLASEFLYECCFQAYLCNNLFQSLLCLLLNIQLSFKHGLCRFHAMAYVGYGVLVSGHFGKHEIGLRTSRLASEILQVSEQGKQIQARVVFVACADNDAWILPKREVHETLTRGHLAGMQCGDLEFAFRDSAFKIHYSYLTGMSLPSVEQECSKVIEEAIRYKVDCIIGILYEIRFLFVHLMGCSSDNWKSASSDTMLTVDDEESKTAFKIDEKNKHNKILNWKKIESYGADQDDDQGEGYKLLHGLLSRLELAVYFDELEVAEKMADAASKVFQVCSQYVIVATRLCFSSLAASGLLRKTKKKKYAGQARTLLATLKKAPGASNHHLCQLMHADLKAALSTLGKNKKHSRKERSSNVGVTKTCSSIQDAGVVDKTAIINKESNRISQLYDQAISAAYKNGSVHHAALGNELAGKHFLSIVEEKSLAINYLKQARNLYMDWGATQKVEHLHFKYGSLLS